MSSAKDMEVNDQYHMGHMLYESFLKKPDSICQIDASTGESETFGSVLQRSSRLAKCFRRSGLEVGDLVALSGRNHLDIHIPYYAAIMCGLPVAGIDQMYKYDEIRTSFDLIKPKVAICQRESFEDMTRAVKELGLGTRVLMFDDGEHSLNQFMKTYDDVNDREEFKPSEFKAAEVILAVVSTSGTTGAIKFATFKHKMIVDFFNGVRIYHADFASKCMLNLSPLQWISAIFVAAASPVLHAVKLQTSAPATVDHVIDMINKYRPVAAIVSPSLTTQILKNPKPCDLTCFTHLSITGSKVANDMLLQIRERVGEAGLVNEVYGQTETFGGCFKTGPDVPVGSCGMSMSSVEYKLIDLDTKEEITEPCKTGELLIKGRRFDGYYNMPLETQKAFTPDGFYRTGDLLYRDENNYWYYVDRIKLLIKYNGYTIPPVELEDVLRHHPGIDDVAVTSVPDEKYGELAVACVVRSPGSDVTAQQVKDEIASQLSENKHLRGGVVFLDSLPTTSTGKIARAKLREFVKSARRE